ncbi:nucleoid-associated protein [Bacillus cereus group sp. MYBK228-1]|uniref:nucleoid-associated protein n=1 Tax=unclassified Bacillus cereus group TaxID=2750818 RepID=UPI003F7A1E76
MGNIEIKKVIAHHMDLKATKPTFLNNVIDISKKEMKDVVQFFEDHVKKALTTPQLKTCVFKSEDDEVYKYCKELAETQSDDKLFVKITRRMTIKLFHNMQKTSSTSSATLIFLHYFNVDSEKDYLGILKMDPNDGIELDPEHVTFKVRKHMLPNVKERLHKSSFIKLDEELFTEESHLYVLDKQQKMDGVSKFFLDAFLNAKEVNSDKKTTEIFNKAVMEVAKNENLPDRFSIAKKISDSMTDGKYIKIDSLLEEILHDSIPGEEDRFEFIERVKQQMKRRNEDAQFEFTVEKEKEAFSFIYNEDKSIQLRFKSILLGTDIFYEEEDDGDGNKFIVLKIREKEVKSNVEFKK